MKINPADLMVKVTEWITHPIEGEEPSYSNVTIVVNNNEIIEPQCFPTGYDGMDVYRGVE